MSRETTTREAQSRPTALDYSPPSALQMPPAPPGVHYRWVRETLPNGRKDERNIWKRQKEGFTPVLGSAHPDWGGTSGEPIRAAELMLMQIPMERVEARRRYEHEKARSELRTTDVMNGRVIAGTRLPGIGMRDQTEVVAGGRRRASAE